MPQVTLEVEHTAGFTGRSRRRSPSRCSWTSSTAFSTTTWVLTSSAIPGTDKAAGSGHGRAHFDSCTRNRRDRQRRRLGGDDGSDAHSQATGVSCAGVRIALWTGEELWPLRRRKCRAPGDPATISCRRIMRGSPATSTGQRPGQIAAKILGKTVALIFQAWMEPAEHGHDDAVDPGQRHRSRSLDAVDAWLQFIRRVENNARTHHSWTRHGGCSRRTWCATPSSSRRP